MGQPYVGEIRMFAGNFAPAGWEFCHGQLLSIAENEVLFQLIGTTYGGDGQSTFALPDLRGRLPLHMGSGMIIGETGGVEAVTLTTTQMPAHSHPVVADGQPATTVTAAGGIPAQGEEPLYALAADGPTVLMAAAASAGGSQPHDNLQPYLCVSFIISLFGIFPSPT